MTDDVIEVAYDPFAADPSPAYPLLRAAECPVFLYQGPEFSFHVLSRHADVRMVLAQGSIFTMKYGQMHTFVPGQGLTVDPPEHTVMRRLLNPLFSPQRVALLTERIEQIAGQLVERMIDHGETDLYAGFGSIYPVHVAAEILGVEPSRREDFRRWTLDFTSGLNSGDSALETKAREAVYSYFSELLARRRADIARGVDCVDDLITTMVQGRHPEGRPFRDEELLPTTILLLAGGVDTSSFLITNCLYRLLERPRLWKRICESPDLIQVAIEESLRFDSPVFGTFRTNDEPFCLHGIDLPRDSKVQLLYASANRDASVFEDPDTFSLDRDILSLRRDHLAFGGGIHACIGNSFARLSARVAISTLARLMPSLELAGLPRRYTPVPGAIAINNGFVTLPIRTGRT